MIAVDFEPSKHRNIDHGKPRRALAGRSRPLKTIFPVAGDPRPTSPTLFAKRVSEPRNLETSNSKHRTRNIELETSNSKHRNLETSKHRNIQSASRLPRHFLRNAFPNLETSKHRTRNIELETSKPRNIESASREVCLTHAKPRRALAGRFRPPKTIFPVAVGPRPTSLTLFAKRVFETSKHRNIETSKGESLPGRCVPSCMVQGW